MDAGSNPGKEDKMKNVVTALVVAALCACAWAANNTMVDPRPTANPQSTPTSLQSLDAITIPQMLSYQGKLTDTLGVPVADTLYAIRFRLYAQPTGGTQFWEEDQQVRTQEGLFSVLLGSVTPIGSVPDAGALYLGMAVSGGAELTPRLRIASAAYAYLSERAADSDLLQGRDTTTFSRSTHNHDATYVNEGQADAVTSAMVVNGTVQTVDIGDTAVTMAKIARAGATSGQVVKWTGSAWAPGQDNTGGGSGVTNVYQDTGIVCVPNPITTTGNVKLDLTFGDSRYVNEAQANSVTSGMITDGTVTSADIRDTTVVTTKLKDAAVTAPKLSQMGAATNQVLKWSGAAWAPANDSTGGGSMTSVSQDTGITCVPNPITSTGSVKLDLSYSDGRYVNETQANSITSAMITDGDVTSADIRDTTVNTAELKDAAVTMPKLNQGGATSGQVIKWTGSAWAPGNDDTGGGSVTSVGQDTGIICVPNPITSSGNVKLDLAYSDARYVNRTGDSMTGWLAVQTNLRAHGKGLIGSANANDGLAAFVVGEGDTASGHYSSVTGGQNNNASGANSHVGGGGRNQASGSYAVVAGGDTNHATGSYTTACGGRNNVAAGYTATVGGGYLNVAGDAASDSGAAVCGGRQNSAVAAYSYVGGGRYNCASGYRASVVAGYADTASGWYSSVAGGEHNTAAAGHTFVGGGQQNNASGTYSCVGGGLLNEATGMEATIGGGEGNGASGLRSTIGGGYYNYACSTSAAVGGGQYDTASGTYAVVAGGRLNNASGAQSTVGGGNSNVAGGSYSTVGGGGDNIADDLYATVGGGKSNIASGGYACVPGGWCDTASSSYSFAANYGSKASNTSSSAFNGQATTAASQTRVGVLSKASGTFTIDHPLDPYGTILNHYFIEGPEMRNIYDGEAVLDAFGRAVVKLPDYFDALNRRPRVQLTGVGTQEVVYVAEDVSGNRFTIGGPAGAKVYWQVTGERKDVSAEATRRMMPVEQPKTGPLTGRMLDDDFLVGCMDQLVREGKAQGIDFRTAGGRARYEKMQQLIEHR